MPYVQSNTSAVWPPTGIATGNTLEAVACAHSLRRCVQLHNFMETVLGVLGLAGVSIVATEISATIGTATPISVQFGSWITLGSIWLTWWITQASARLGVHSRVQAINKARELALLWQSSALTALEAEIPAVVREGSQGMQAAILSV